MSSSRPNDLSAQIAALYRRQTFGIRLGLARMRQAVVLLGHPERRYRIIHIAGTNGKGSTAAMCASILRAAGHRVGLTTSPHLVRLHERFVVNGRPITDSALAQHLARVQSLGLDLTFFETTILVAFLHFAESAVDWAVIEVGLGGRLDATNVVTPDVAILTPVALDHTEHLGPTVLAIAREKLGIVKRGVPVVCAWTAPQLIRAATQGCNALHAPLSLFGRDFDSAPLEPSAHGEPLLFRDEKSRGRFFTSLIGLHQVSNAALAIRAMRIIGIQMAAIRNGLARVQWPGRLHRIGRFILDGAHNPHGAEALAAELSRRFPGRRFPIVFGAMRDKAIPAMLSALSPMATAFHFVAVDPSRGETPKALMRLARPIPITATPHATLRDALAKTTGKTVVTGSLYLVGAALDQLGRARPK